MKEKGGKIITLPFITRVEELKRRLNLSNKKIESLKRVIEYYPLKIPLFYFNLIEKDNPHCPIKKQCIPDIRELDLKGEWDPLVETKYSITPSFIKKYPGRGVFLSGTQCAMYCRFCNRKRLQLEDRDIKQSHIETFHYLKGDRSINEIIISGGDPLMLPPEELEFIIKNLVNIKHIRILRISSRVPVVYPEGITEKHLKCIRGVNPLWFIVHINHPREVTEEFSNIIKKLKRAGCFLLSHTVLLKGVNDCPYILKELFERLIVLGIKPYYLFQLDEVRGISHFKVKLKKGIEIMKILRKETSGLALPTYVIDITGGAGKIPVDYNYIKYRMGNRLVIEDFRGKAGTYTDNGGKSTCKKCPACYREK